MPRYRKAYYDWQMKEYGQVMVHDLPGIYAKTQHDKLEKKAENYIKWIGGKAIQTPTKGTPLYKEVQVGSKIVRQVNGFGRAKGGKGKQDTVIIYKGQTFFVDWKVGKDFQKDHQHGFQVAIESAGGVYLLLHSMHDLYAVIDKIDKGENIQLLNNT